MALTQIDDRGLKTPIDLQDNEKIRLGTGNDLELYHDGSGSDILNSAGSGQLTISSDNALNLASRTGTEYFFRGYTNGAAELYYDNSKKIETTSAGTTTSGVSTTTDGNGSVNIGGNYLLLERTSGTTNYLNAPNADAELYISADEAIRFGTVHTGDFNSTERLRIDSSGRLLQGKNATKGSTGENVPRFCTEIASNNPNVFEIANNGTSSANSYSVLALTRSDGTSVNSHTAVDSGDQIGEVCFIGADGADRFNTAAAIKTFASSDFSANDCPAYLSFFTNGGYAAATERMRIDSSGKVGIGTTSPDGLLSIKGTTDTYFYLQNDSTGTASGDGSRIGFTGASSVLRIQNQEDGPIAFHANGSEVIRFHADGSLLIGTTSSLTASSKIQCFGSSDSSMILGNTTTSASGTITLNLAPSNSITGAQIICEATEDFSSSANRSAKLTLQTRYNGTFYESLKIAETGNILCKSVTNSGNHFQLDNTTTSNTGCMFNINSSRDSSNGSYFLAQWGSSSTTRFQVFDSGDVQNVSGTFQSISDKTLKENIVDAGSQWNDIKNLKVRKFNFKETTDPDKKTMIGVIAQEAETVCPNLVETSKTKQGGEEKEFKTFKYSILYMKAIKCLQEAQAKIETLETKVAALESA